MNLKEQFRLSWTFALAVLVFVLFKTLSVTRILNVSDELNGLLYIFLTITLIYTSFKSDIKLRKSGDILNGRLMLFGAGMLSGIWLIQAIDLLI